MEALFGERLIDDGDAGYREEGSDFQGNLSRVEEAFEQDYRFRFEDGSDQFFGAFWTFQDLNSGVYEVLATWPEANSLTDAVSYTYVTASPILDLARSVRHGPGRSRPASRGTRPR